MNSKVCICVEETIAGICRDHGHNPVVIAATKKRLINVIFMPGEWSTSNHILPLKGLCL